MANYFVLVSTHDDKERDSFYSDTQLKSHNLSIGWGKVNPLFKTVEELKYAIETFYPEKKGTVNPDNGSKSLSLFANLKPGDIIFVRGSAKIVDVVVITGRPFFDSKGHYKADYFMKVPFLPLFSAHQSDIDTANIPTDIYKEVLFDGGRSLVMRSITEEVARNLIKALAVKF